MINSFIVNRKLTRELTRFPRLFNSPELVIVNFPIQKESLTHRIPFKVDLPLFQTPHNYLQNDKVYTPHRQWVY